MRIWGFGKFTTIHINKKDIVYAKLPSHYFPEEIKRFVKKFTQAQKKHKTIYIPKDVEIIIVKKDNK